MFAPTKVFRKWHVKVNKKMKRMAVRAALAASAIPALVMARGHNLNDVPEIPLVVPSSVEALEKTKDAVKLLKDIGAYNDVEKVIGTKTIRAGKGKWRNRRYAMRKGPLLVVSKNCDAVKAFRNIPGVDINYVSALNLLRLAPGGHCGRLVIWTEDAFKSLDKAVKCKTPEGLPDSKRVINSEEVQGVCRGKRRPKRPVNSNKPRPMLNPAFKIERKIQKRLHILRQSENLDPKKRMAKLKAKKLVAKQWLGKVRGALGKSGQKDPNRKPKQKATNPVKIAKRARAAAASKAAKAAASE